MKTKYLAMLLLTGNVLALSTQLNLSTLGLGAKLKQNITDNVSVVGAVDYIAMDLNLGSANLNTSGNINLGGINANTDTNANVTHSASIQNVSLGVGLEYKFINNDNYNLGLEGGFKYNILGYNDSLNGSIGGSISTTGRLYQYQKNINSVDTTKASINLLAPYAQINLDTYITKNTYIATSLGAVYDNLNVVGVTSGKSSLSIPVMPILGVELGYRF